MSGGGILRGGGGAAMFGFREVLAIENWVVWILFGRACLLIQTGSFVFRLLEHTTALRGVLDRGWDGCIVHIAARSV